MTPADRAKPRRWAIVLALFLLCAPLVADEFDDLHATVARMVKVVTLLGQMRDSYSAAMLSIVQADDCGPHCQARVKLFAGEYDRIQKQINRIAKEDKRTNAD